MLVKEEKKRKKERNINDTDDVKKYRNIPVSRYFFATVYYRLVFLTLRIPRPDHLVDDVIS